MMKWTAVETPPVEVERIVCPINQEVTKGIKSGHYGYWVHHGELRIKSQLRTFKVGEQELAWIGAGEQRKVVTTGPACWMVIRVRNRAFAPGNGADRIAWQALMRLGRLGRSVGMIPLSAGSRQAIDRMIAEMSSCYAESDGQTGSPLMKAGLFRLLMCIVRDPVFLREEAAGPGRKAREDSLYGIRQERLQRVLLIIEEEAARLSGAESLARRCGLSRSGLYRLLSAERMPSPLVLMERARLDLATRLMVQSEKAILEIALEAGFPSLSTFYRAFHRAFGLSPGQWRRQSRIAD